MKMPTSVSDWQPETPKGTAAMDKLMNPNAKDASDTMTGTNEQKAWKSKGSKPSGPFGLKGKEF